MTTMEAGVDIGSLLAARVAAGASEKMAVMFK
jgi:hypothetical protein